MKYSMAVLALLVPAVATLTGATMRQAHAQATPGTKTGSNFIAGASVPWVPMAEWERPGGMSSIAAGDDEIAKAPPTASKYRSKTFTFPTGTIRVLEFGKGDVGKVEGGFLHKITFETEIFVVKGSVDIGVRGAVKSLKAGDAVNLPAGDMTAKPDAGDIELVLFTVGSSAKDPAATVVHPEDAKPIVLPPEKGAPSQDIKFYAFDGNSIRTAAVKAPGTTGVVTPKVDSIIYMLSGHMRNLVGTEIMDVHAGDALREPAGLETHWDVFEDSLFVATSAPFDPHPIAAAK
jgi:quercetin dioxygenase-like cupin family protein